MCQTKGTVKTKQHFEVVYECLIMKRNGLGRMISFTFFEFIHAACLAFSHVYRNYHINFPVLYFLI